MSEKNVSKAIVRVLAGAVLATAGSAALAAWDFGGSAATWSGTGVNTKAVATDANGVKATASAYYTNQTTFAVNTNGNNNGTKFAQATLGKNTGGLGVISGAETTDSPDHSIDNSGNTDMVLLNFSLAVDLNKVLIGWAQTDSDFSVLRYTGASPLNADLSLNYTGWSLVANVNGSATGNTLTTYDITGANPSTTTSSWWLISAFSTGFGGLANGASSTSTASTKDYFKLASLEGSYTLPTTPNAVPEPASLALVGIALVGLLGARRRRAAKR